MAAQRAEWRTRNIGRLLLCAADAFVTDKLQEVHNSGFGPVTQVHIALIQNLDLDGTRLTLIADRARMTKQSMLELVDKAEGLGFVERQPDPADGRAKIVAFTPTGLRMMGRLQEGIAEAERHMAALTGTAFLAEMKAKLAAYVGAGNAAAGTGLEMWTGNAAWRMHNAGRVMRSAFGIFSHDVLGTIRKGGFRMVSEVHMTLFRNLDLDGTRPTEIAARARMTKQAMADLVAKTELLGLVACVPDPNDGRAKTVVFTKAGLRMFERTRIGVEEAERRMATAIGDAFVAEMKMHLAAYVAGAGRFADVATDPVDLALAEGLRSGARSQASGDAPAYGKTADLGRSPRSSRMSRAG